MSHLVVAPVLFPLFAATILLLLRRVIPLSMRRRLNLAALLIQILLVSLLAQRVVGARSWCMRWATGRHLTGS
jgi:multicomponent K+:H+ antiporter subunit D